MNCVFCQLQKMKENIVFETDHFIFLQAKFPITKGHHLLITKKHIQTEINIPKSQVEEYMKLNTKAYAYIHRKFKAPLLFINAPQDQSIKHFHKHFIPGKFKVHGVQNALIRALKRSQSAKSGKPRCFSIR